MSDINFELNDSQYRIHRPDNLNLSIQKLGGHTWRTLSYHGSSLHSLAYGLKGLIADSCVPDPARSLGEQLADLRRAIGKLEMTIAGMTNGL